MIVMINDYFFEEEKFSSTSNQGFPGKKKSGNFVSCTINGSDYNVKVDLIGQEERGEVEIGDGNGCINQDKDGEREKIKKVVKDTNVRDPNM